MGKLTVVTVALLAVISYYLYNRIYGTPLQFKLEADGWYGKGPKVNESAEISSIKIVVPDVLLQELREKLDKTKLPLSLEDSNSFEYGFNPTYLRDVIKYWRNSYDWRRWEKMLNQWPQFTTSIEGLKIHFIHARPPAGKYKVVLPLMLLHGWPGNVFEFYKLIPLLTDPAQHLKMHSKFAFEVIAPSIPGFGWSSPPMKKGFNQWSAARVFRKLMIRLGHQKFYLQGGDWGSIISRNIAIYYPENVLGLHLNLLQVTPSSNIKVAIMTILGYILPPSYLFKHPGSFLYGLEAVQDLLLQETGYFHIQATKPDTVGIGLTDSPAGLAAYILEKFSTGTARENRLLPDGGLTKKFTLDELLTVVTIYWINGNIAYSQRFYKEFMLSKHKLELERAYIHTPTACAAFPNEMLYGSQPPELLGTVVNLTRYTELAHGGHFAALEEPKLLAKDIFEFVYSLL